MQPARRTGQWLTFGVRPLHTLANRFLVMLRYSTNAPQIRFRCWVGLLCLGAVVAWAEFPDEPSIKHMVRFLTRTIDTDPRPDLKKLGPAALPAAIELL